MSDEPRKNGHLGKRCDLARLENQPENKVREQ
jgi:hypothetical protein